MKLSDEQLAMLAHGQPDEIVRLAGKELQKARKVVDAAKIYVDVMCDGPVEDAGDCWSKLSSALKASEEE